LNQTNQANNQSNHQRKNTRNTLKQLPPLSMPLKDLYAKLLSIDHIAHIPIPLLQPPFHVWCKPGLTYEYHASNPCYGIEICYAFKKKLMELIKIGWVTFEDLPNINSNLLPNHAI